jgi:flagellar basal-body rod protein FlgG
VINGLGAAASGMRAQMAYMNAVSNDVSNANTAGYKSQRVSLEATATPGVAARSAGPSTAQGAVAQTGQPFDLAIVGDGWFQVRQPNGQVGLTRAGSFRLDNGGQLVTPDGDALDPPVRLPLGVDPGGVAIARDGTVTAGGAAAGRVSVVSVPNPGGLIATGGGVYAPTAASGPIQPATAQIEQGTLEMSNTDLTETSVGMIVGQAAFTAAARSFTAQDETLRTLLETVR